MMLPASRRTLVVMLTAEVRFQEPEGASNINEIFRGLTA